MPRVARFKVAAIENLFRQLEYAPADTRRRQMDAAESLVHSIDPVRNYPEDFIVFRITGYRPESKEEPTTLVGEALRPDLVTLVQTLSDGLDLAASEGQRQAIELTDVARRLNVSLKSVQRYRRQGLVCHRIRQPDGTRRLMCYADALDRFIAANRAQVERARKFSRLPETTETTIVDQARRLRQAQPESLNGIAQRLSADHGRAIETIRQVLRRHDRHADEPIFSDRGPMTAREARMAHRAWIRGIEPAAIARRLGKSKPTVHRAINQRRAMLLRGCNLSHIELQTFLRAEAHEVILAAPAVTTGLPGGPIVHASGDELVAMAAGLAALTSRDEEALLAAFNFLKRRAASGIAALGPNVRSDALDRIETDLRWLAMLKRRLNLAALPAAMKRVEHVLHRHLDQLPRERLNEVTAMAIRVAGDAVEQVDPSRGQRLQRLAAFLMDRELARLPPEGVPRKAMQRHGSPRPVRPPAHQFSCEGEPWLALRMDLATHIEQLDEPMGKAMTQRYGEDGNRPRTIQEISAAISLTPLRTARLVQAATRRLRERARAETARTNRVS